MIHCETINKEVEKIKKMNLDQLFKFGQAQYIKTKEYREKHPRLEFELESDINYVNNTYLAAVVESVFEKKYNINKFISYFDIEKLKNEISSFNELIDLLYKEYLIGENNA